MLRKMMTIMGLASLILGMAGTASAGMWGSSNPCNPCSMEKMKHNPCSMNPCHAKEMKHNPCSMNPCGMKKMQHNPCSMNPCHMNPVDSAGNEKKKIRAGKFNSFQEAAAVGKKMWEDETLGKAGIACLTCHEGFDSLNLDKRQNFPHYVEMVGDVVTLDQMINFCMINPMDGEQLEPNSKAMTAMAAYFRAYRMKYLSER